MFGGGDTTCAVFWTLRLGEGPKIEVAATDRSRQLVFFQAKVWLIGSDWLIGRD